ncbi:hypothetical protein OG785_45530 [Streptomyces sp. NBC_00006]|uniref:hypothetical protein n=1 Tax=Streptomyces sp. NBC_00006 TaxID=2975619 RepID=UPI002257C694|nr:hypothetical protein [Streptomyces sp. NBC_00006]MCX5537822.1 hypothetical protein [Streptomyces sp. NBC_00006]
MTTPPPEPRPTTQAGQRHVSPETQKILDEIENVYSKPVPKSIRVAVDTQHVSPPPVAQQGLPPMSQKGMDDSVRLICFGGTAFLTCGGVAIVMIASDHADPTAIGVFFGGIAGIVLAVRALVTRAKRLVPSEHHHHYNAPVEQDFSSHESKHFSLTAKHDHTINTTPPRKGRR